MQLESAKMYCVNCPGLLALKLVSLIAEFRRGEVETLGFQHLDIVLPSVACVARCSVRVLGIVFHDQAIRTFHGRNV